VFFPEFKPLKNVSWCEERGLWRAERMPVRMRVDCDKRLLRKGWVLFEGILWRVGDDFCAVLVAQTASDEVRFSLPVTRRGRIYELVQLPEGTRRLLLEPMQVKGFFSLQDFCMHRADPWLRFNTMRRRVMPMLQRLSHEQWDRLGLVWHDPITNLPKLYALAGRLRASAASLHYDEWIARFEHLSRKDIPKLARQAAQFARNGPKILVLLDMRESNSEWLELTLDSLREQLYPAADLQLLVASREERDMAMGLAVDEQRCVQLCDLSARLHEGGWSSVLLLQAGVQLTPFALYWFALEQKRCPQVALIYSDHDRLDAQGVRCAPQFKPDWSLELARSSGYVGKTYLVDAAIILACLEQGDRFDSYVLLLLAAQQLPASAIAHIPAILWHMPLALNDKLLSRRALERHLAEQQIDARVERDRWRNLRIRYGLPEPLPLVSIVIPTRDKLELIKPCVESILSKTSYRRFELLIIDNGSVDPAVLKFLDKCDRLPFVRVLGYHQPFNFSAINNFASEWALGEMLCLLNNDTEVISEDWLDEMVSLLAQPEVGVVGAKLYYTDGRVQHAGDSVGPGGMANHLHGLLWRGEPGYMDRAMLVQELSAVTGACLLTWRALYERLGGLDEANLPVAYNDVDYCLRVNDYGKRVLFTPHAELYHHESLSRSEDNSQHRLKQSRQEANYMRQRWKKFLRHDPFYNPNLNYMRSDFSLSHAPAVKRPW
jgi:GT2 family glycosyltransferase